MNKKLILSLTAINLFLAGCVDIPVRPHATENDPSWIRKFDARLMASESKLIDEHEGTTDSKILLFQSIECLRDVSLDQLRAANAIAKRAMRGSW